jgi:plasmid replication initiation protein
MANELTSLQKSLIERLRLVGMEEFADRATAAWIDRRPYPCALTPAERATMEGANLCEPYKAANREARASQAAAVQSCQV